MKRVLLTVVCFILCLTLIGCDKGKTNDPVETNEPETAETEEVTTKDTTDDTTDEPVVDPAEDPSVSLNSFRQSMVGTTELFAAAYIGHTDTMDDVDPIPWMKGKVPGLCEDLPFMTAIPEENIVGDHFGELYCIVPATEDITLAVSSIEFDGNDIEVLYKGKPGEPILLFCNKDGHSPDVEVTVTKADGSFVLWYPKLNDDFYLVGAYDLDGVDVTKDFTPYAKLIENEYEYYLNEAGFWKVPEVLDLVDTSWEATDYCLDGTEKVYYLDIFADNVHVTWNDGVDEENHSYTAPWTLKVVDGLTVMEIDFGSFEGIRTYPVLITSEHNLIYFSQDFLNDDIHDYEKLSRVLERTYG
ncbi:MAG: hypothetical protein IJB24_02920 [Clostridia bacterium]|nr:hypothetical protein [Clostridia bacterium]